MAKNTVPVNFKDDIMNSSMGGKRRYKMINNSDGTISLEDATTYDQAGSNFGAAQLNATNQAVNAAADAGKIIDDIDAIRNVTKEGYMAGALALKQVDESLGDLKFGYDTETQKYGYYVTDSVGADTFFPFKSGDAKTFKSNGKAGTFDAELGFTPDLIFIRYEGTTEHSYFIREYNELHNTHQYYTLNSVSDSKINYSIGNNNVVAYIFAMAK